MADKSPSERFVEKYIPEPNSGCWLWSAAVSSHGYGVFYDGERLRPAHRMSYELFVGPIPDALQIDHLCRVRSCVNPAHLEPVTQQENFRRGEGKFITAKVNGAKTHCPKGHPYSGDNLYMEPSGGRGCRACRRESARRFIARKRG